MEVNPETVYTVEVNPETVLHLKFVHAVKSSDPFSIPPNRDEELFLTKLRHPATVPAKWIHHLSATARKCYVVANIECLRTAVCPFCEALWPLLLISSQLLLMKHIEKGSLHLTV